MLADTPLVPISEKAEPLDKGFALRHPLLVLVAEDDPVNLKLTTKMLKDLGYDPLTARDGRDAIDVYLSRHPNCVLMDMRMPARDGLTAARRIREMERERSAEIPIFLAALTANVLPEERANCLDAGMDDYLSKPFKRRRLAEILAMASARVTGSVNQQDYKHNM